MLNLNRQSQFNAPASLNAPASVTAGNKGNDLREKASTPRVLSVSSIMSKSMSTMMFLSILSLLVLMMGVAHAEIKPVLGIKSVGIKSDGIKSDNSIKTDASKQDMAAVKASIVEFLTTQSIGYPGNVNVSAGAIDPNLKLAACSSIRVFLPPGSRAWGKTSVAVRCDAPVNWTIYVQALVSVSAQYLVAAAPLAQGHVVTSDDLMFENGELTQLPAGVFTDIGQAVGRSVSVSIGAGTVLRQEMLKLPPVVQQGQTVMVTSIGNGFSVSAEGRALTNANEGQIVQVKVASGQVLSGIARNGGQIQIGY